MAETTVDLTLTSLRGGQEHWVGLEENKDNSVGCNFLAPDNQFREVRSFTVMVNGFATDGGDLAAQLQVRQSNAIILRYPMIRTEHGGGLWIYEFTVGAALRAFRSPPFWGPENRLRFSCDELDTNSTPTVDLNFYLATDIKRDYVKL